MNRFSDPNPSSRLRVLLARVQSGALDKCRAALLVAGLTGCQEGFTLHPIMQQWRADDELAEHVEDALLETRQLNLGHIDVDVEDGVVYLSGEMDSSDSKAKAYEITEKVQGVKKVVNKLEVEP